VFILVDKPNEELDAMLSDHIMNLHSGRAKTTSASFATSSQSSLASASSTSLKDRLRLAPGEELDLIPHELLSKFIAYARQACSNCKMFKIFTDRLFILEGPEKNSANHE